MSTDKPHRPVGGPVEAWLVVLGVLTIAGSNLVFWRIDYPPLIDWANHLARHAIQCAEDPLAGIGRYYEYHFAWVPNLTSELVHRLPIACRSVMTTQKVLIQFATTGLLLATILLHASIWRRWSVWPLLSSFGMFHMAFAYGFENYILALPPMLLALSVWFWRRQRGAFGRLLPMIPVVAIIFILHLYAFMFLFGMIGLLELQRWWSRGRNWPEFGRVALLMLLIVAGPAAHLASVIQVTAGVDIGEIEFGSPSGWLGVVLSPFGPLGVAILNEEVFKATWIQFFAVVAVFVGFRFLRPPLTMNPVGRLAVVGMLIAALMMPTTLGAVHYTDIRFPVALFCVLIALSDIRFSRIGAFVFVVAVSGASVARVSWLETYWSNHDHQVRELLSLSDVLSGDHRILVARTADPIEVLLHSHSAAHLSRVTGAFIPDIFSSHNSLSARPEFALRDAYQSFPQPVSRLIEEVKSPRPAVRGQVPDGSLYWADWTKFYTHVLVFSRQGESVPEIPELGRVVERGSFFALFETKGSF
ncbi:MAG: hypothetical protein R3186_11220 [Ruegeria sp.]|nr:hypothetical protein [Ruegeria sp.]